jgi:hypothetical protein
MSEEIRRELERYCWDLNITKEEARHIQELFIKQEQHFIKIIQEEIERTPNNLEKVGMVRIKGRIKEELK